MKITSKSWVDTFRVLNRIRELAVSRLRPGKTFGRPTLRGSSSSHGRRQLHGIRVKVTADLLNLKLQIHIPQPKVHPETRLASFGGATTKNILPSEGGRLLTRLLRTKNKTLSANISKQYSAPEIHLTGRFVSKHQQYSVRRTTFS